MSEISGTWRLRLRGAFAIMQASRRELVLPTALGSSRRFGCYALCPGSSSSDDRGVSIDTSFSRSSAASSSTPNNATCSPRTCKITPVRASSVSSIEGHPPSKIGNGCEGCRSSPPGRIRASILPPQPCTPTVIRPSQGRTDLARSLPVRRLDLPRILHVSRLDLPRSPPVSNTVPTDCRHRPLSAGAHRASAGERYTG